MYLYTCRVKSKLFYLRNTFLLNNRALIPTISLPSVGENRQYSCDIFFVLYIKRSYDNILF